MVYIGTSGWQYKHWRGRFYPEELPQKEELQYYAGKFRIVELNATFYKLPEAKTFKKWTEGTPDDFIFAMKASRYLTHFRKLKNPKEPVHRLLRHARPMKDKLGPVLLQLPPNFPRNDERLEETLKAFPKDIRVAVEFRHESWFTDEVKELLSKHHAALCIADRGSRLITPLWKTAGWTFIRFHAGAASPQPCYSRSTMNSRAEAFAKTFGKTSDLYVFFNNDPSACAVRDAGWFGLAVDRLGMKHTRVPEAGEVAVG